AVAGVAVIKAARNPTVPRPLCQPLVLPSISVRLAAEGDDAVRITASRKLAGQTGVEMEALTAASVAALPIYDMCKAVDRGMVIESVRLLEKLGGKRGHFMADQAQGSSCRFRSSLLPVTVKCWAWPNSTEQERSLRRMRCATRCWSGG
ncbi:hypothetical protein EWW49_34745, partial [Pseudomonas syringae]